MEAPLFSSIPWFTLVEVQTTSLAREILDVSETQILNTSFDDLCEYFVNKYSIDVPVLYEADMRVDQRDIKMDLSHDPIRMVMDRSKPFWVNGTIIEIIVPFTGDSEAFKIRPTAHSVAPPRASVTTDAVIFSFKGENLDSNQIKSKLGALLGEVKMFLDQMKVDSDRLRTKLTNEVRRQLSQRRDKFLADRNLVAALGIPLKRRADTPATFRAPEVRRRVQVRPSSVSTTPFAPEPVLEMAEYNQILKIISEMAIVMERSPSAFEDLPEEALRTHFLVPLNGHYEGQATGETFNCSGKTDILIRSGGKNIFIAECKFWGGAKKLLDTIDQLLGYLSWRDNKAAILIFNRQKNFGHVLSEISQTMITHPNYKRTVSQNPDASFRYVFSQKDDVNREMTVTVMAFNIPRPSQS